MALVARLRGGRDMTMEEKMDRYSWEYAEHMAEMERLGENAVEAALWAPVCPRHGALCSRDSCRTRPYRFKKDWIIGS